MHQNKRKRSIPTKLIENQLAQFILKYLPKRQRGPVSKTSILHGDGTSTLGKRGGDNIGYSGHKHIKGDKIAAFCDRLCNVTAPFATAPGNRHESKMFPESFEHLKKIIKKVGYIP